MDENVLVLQPGERQVAFRHHILFDHAASRVYLGASDLRVRAPPLSEHQNLSPSQTHAKLSSAYQYLPRQVVQF